MAFVGQCRACKVPLPGDAPEGICPVCLASIDLADAVEVAKGIGEPGRRAAPSGIGVSERFGDYELLHEIARGGMGVVYKARQISLNRLVAVKMILAGTFAGEEAVKRFQTEAGAAAKLRHPNIVVIHEVGDWEGRHYFSMELIDGHSLAELPRPLPSDVAAGLVKVLAEAIDHAHQRGVLHRDLKPSNVLLDSSGQPRITDFGLAKYLETDNGLTRIGAVMGIPGYMSPEQATGRGEAVGAETDAYSLGAILYDLVTGRPPFAGVHAADTIRQVIEEEPVRPRLLNSALPRDLETICLRCLEKDPRRRYASARELADELSRLLKYEPIHARPLHHGERLLKWARRKPAGAALAGVSILAVMAMAVGALWHQARLGEQLRLSVIDQARVERISGRRDRALDLIARAAERKIDVRLRQEAIQTITGSGVKKVLTIPVNGYWSGFSPDERRFAAHCLHSRPATPGNVDLLRVFATESGVLLRETEWRLPNRPPSGIRFEFSPREPLLAGPNANGTIRIWNYETDSVVAELPEGVAFQFAPDGRHVGVGDAEGIRIYLVDSGNEIRRRTGGVLTAFRSSSELVVWEKDALSLWNFEKGTEQLGVAGAGRVLAVSPNGGRAALELSGTGQENRIVVHDLALKRELDVIAAPNQNLFHARFSRDGRMLAWGDGDDPSLIRMRDVDARKFRRSISARGAVLWPATAQIQGGAYLDNNGMLPWTRYQSDFSLDGRYFALGTYPVDRLRIWDLEAEEFVAEIAGKTHPIWSQVGARLATQGEIWDVTRAVPGLQLENSIRSLEFSSDSLQLAANATLLKVIPDGNGHRLLLSRHIPEAQFVKFGIGDRLVVADIPPASMGVVTLRQESPERKPLFVMGDGFGTFALNSDATRLVTARLAATNRLFQIWDLTTGAEIAAWDWNWDTRLTMAMPGGPSAFSPDGRWLATAGFVSPGFEVWDLSTRKKTSHLKSLKELHSDNLISRAILRVLRRPGTERPDYVVTALRFSLDGEFIVSSSRDGAVTVHETMSGRERARGQHEAGEVGALAMSPGGRWFASGGHDRTIRLWSLPNGREIARWEAGDAGVSALAISPDGTLLASGNERGEVRVWNLPAIRSELGRLGLDW